MCLPDLSPGLPKLGRNQLVSRNFETEQAAPMTNQAAAGRRKTKYPYLVSFSHPELIGDLQLKKCAPDPDPVCMCDSFLLDLQKFVSICLLLLLHAF